MTALKILVPVLVALVAALFGSPINSGLLDGDDNGRHTVTTKVDQGPGKPDVTIVANEQSIDQAADASNHDDLKIEAPPGITLDDIEAIREQTDRFAVNDDIPTVSPLAAPTQPGCKSAFVVNFSSRRGVAPRWIVLHYTVSPNRPGWKDVDNIVALFNRPAFAASSNYVLDREGHCAYIVRESDKAWTQAAANPFSVSFEIINSGKEKNLIDGLGRKRLIAVIVAISKRWNIPLTEGKVGPNCTVGRSGVITHARLGRCAGGHVDVNPFEGEVQGIIRDAAKLRNRRECGTLCQRRKRHEANHQRLRNLGCAKPSKRAKHPVACEKARKLNRELHTKGL